MGRIGGDHGGINAAGTQLDATGDEALASAGEASGYSQQMEAGLDEVTALLKGHFEETATALKEQVTAAKARLAEADWVGTSREQALAAEEALHADVDRVLEHALDAVETFRQSMHGKAEEFRGAVEGEFRSILSDLNDAYHQAGQASRRFAENLQAADETIKFAG